jgi:hypothetical protein
MKHLIAALLLLPPGGDGTPTPCPADFIPAEARPYFNSAKGDRHWGKPRSGWRIGLAPIPHPWTYVDSGGRGEFLPLQVSVFAERPPWRPDDLPEAFLLTIRIAAEGRRDHVWSERVRRDGMSSNRTGTEWTFWLLLMRLQPLEEQWGALPSRVRVSVTLGEDGAPAVSTPAVPVSLSAVSQKDASWSQRVLTLRAGQSRDEVRALLGPALSERLLLRPDGSRDLQLTYPNPDAPQEYPPEMRMTFITLDARGKFLVASLLGGC